MSVTGDHQKTTRPQKKQVNTHNTFTTTKCKQRAVAVCPTSELRAAEPRTCAQLFCLCCQWASPGWGPSQKACTGRPAHSLTSGLHRREGPFPFSDIFYLTVSLSISLYPSLSLFVTRPLSLLFSLSFHGRVHRSQPPGKG